MGAQDKFRVCYMHILRVPRPETNLRTAIYILRVSRSDENLGTNFMDWC
jgi:hypothetical protein